MYQVVKRDGKVVDFAISKISAAITKAFDATGKQYHPSVIELMALHVTSDFESNIRDGKITFEDAARQFSTAPNARQGGSVTNPADGSGRLDKPFVDEHYYNVGVSGMDEGRISNALPTKTDEQRDAYRIVRLNKKYPAHRANLTDDYDNIYNAALTTAKQRYIRKWAQRQLKNTYTRFDAPYQGCVFQNLQ